MTTPERHRDSRSLTHSIRWLAAVVVVVVMMMMIGLAVGCGVAGGSRGGAEGLSITEPWARPTPPGNDRTAIYATVGNGGAESDRLTGVATDRCSSTELHSTVIDDSGVAGMRPADEQALTVTADAELVLEPGGLHVMCVGVTTPLAVGDTFDAIFTFESGSTVEVEVDVAEG